MKILRKIIEAIVPVSKQDMVEIANVIDGLKVANSQQAEMLANLVNQVSGMQMKKAEKQMAEEKGVDDPAFG